MRGTRWRPVCPECGYSLRRLTTTRCPECGVDLPSDRKPFRRWAIRRLAWDRLGRGSLLVAYVKSLVAMVVVPCRAARGVCIPDRWGRTGRWAGVHLAVAALAAALLGSEQWYVRSVVDRIWRAERHPIFPAYPPLDRLAVWASQSFVAWLAALAVPIAIACLISLGLPRRHRAATRRVALGADANVRGRTTGAATARLTEPWHFLP